MTGDDLVRCPDIGRAIAVKACLRRRQEQRLQTKVIRAASDRYGPRVTEQVPVGPLYLACAGCGLGEANAAAELVAEAAPPQPRADPRPGSHLWGGEVPDVPIGPAPGAPRPAPAIGLPAPDAEARVRVVHVGPVSLIVESPSPAPSALVDPEPPARPAQETPVACKDCGSKTNHRAGCPKKAAPEPEKKAAPIRVLKPVRPRAAAALSASREGFAAMPVEDLVVHRTACLEEVRAIEEELRRRREQIEAALGAETARATG